MWRPQTLLTRSEEADGDYHRESAVSIWHTVVYISKCLILNIHFPFACSSSYAILTTYTS